MNKATYIIIIILYFTEALMYKFLRVVLMHSFPDKVYEQKQVSQYIPSKHIFFQNVNTFLFPTSIRFDFKVSAFSATLTFTLVDLQLVKMWYHE